MFNQLTINEPSYPDVYVGMAYFENIDFEGKNYLKEKSPPRRIEEAKSDLATLINSFVYNSNVLTRDVSAVIRDAEPILKPYKDTGGSILYILTSTDSVTNDTIIETDVAERLALNNIKIIIGESGPGQKALSRFSVVSQSSYYFIANWTSTYFTNINNEIISLCATGLLNQRRTVSF